MPCSGTTPTFSAALTVSLADCVATISTQISIPCDAGGYQVKIYAKKDGTPSMTPDEVIYTADIPAYECI